MRGVYTETTKVCWGKQDTKTGISGGKECLSTQWKKTPKADIVSLHYHYWHTGHMILSPECLWHHALYANGQFKILIFLVNVCAYMFGVGEYNIPRINFILYSEILVHLPYSEFVWSECHLTFKKFRSNIQSTGLIYLQTN